MPIYIPMHWVSPNTVLWFKYLNSFFFLFPFCFSFYLLPPFHLPLFPFVLLISPFFFPFFFLFINFFSSYFFSHRFFPSFFIPFSLPPFYLVCPTNHLKCPATFEHGRTLLYWHSENLSRDRLENSPFEWLKRSVPKRIHPLIISTH